MENYARFTSFRGKLTFTTFLANAADDKLIFVFSFVPENSLCHFMQIVMKCQSLFSRKYKKNISKYRFVKFLLSMLSVLSIQAISLNKLICETTYVTKPGTLTLALLTLVLLNSYIPCIRKQCRSRSVSFFRS